MAGGQDSQSAVAKEIVNEKHDPPAAEHIAAQDPQNSSAPLQGPEVNSAELEEVRARVTLFFSTIIAN